MYKKYNMINRSFTAQEKYTALESPLKQHSEAFVITHYHITPTSHRGGISFLRVVLWTL